MYEKSHPVFSKLQEIGREITQKNKPKAIVVFSAHWQAYRNEVEVNTAEKTELIYDFYGFPDYYYKMQFPNTGSKEVAEKVLSLLNAAGIKASPTKRGLDHGVWAGFHVAFDPKANPLNVPIVQVSLFDSDDPDQHYRLGQALSPLRDEQIQIIGSGMAVHNLRDLSIGFSIGDMSNPRPYVHSFDEALKEGMTAKPEERQAKMASLVSRPDTRLAHPHLDHLLPTFIAAGAAGEDLGERLWTMNESGGAWAQYRFGRVPETQS